VLQVAARKVGDAMLAAQEEVQKRLLVQLSDLDGGKAAAELEREGTPPPYPPWDPTTSHPMGPHPCVRGPRPSQCPRTRHCMRDALFSLCEGTTALTHRARTLSTPSVHSSHRVSHRPRTLHAIRALFALWWRVQ
jgi:hypothetical protein